MHTVGYSWQYSQNVFDAVGDAGFAGLMAHEFGHAAQNTLGIRGGWMDRVVYKEAFADCMAGGWLVQMYNWGYYDNVGRGDWREWLDALTGLSDSTTTLDNHGTPAWRHQNATYGWNTGMRGCIAWFRSIAA